MDGCTDVLPKWNKGPFLLFYSIMFNRGPLAFFLLVWDKLYSSLLFCLQLDDLLYHFSSMYRQMDIRMDVPIFQVYELFLLHVFFSFVSL